MAPSNSRLRQSSPARLASSEPGSNQPARRASDEEESTYLAGEVVADRYRLVRELGKGGMGVVWVAHSLVLGVDVALKLIRASRAAKGVASRMAREAHAAARLGHPALVRVFDFGWTSRGDPFLVMELAQGETLSNLLAREGRIGAIRAAQMLLPIADGLRTAHDKGIVHRDIKPDNVFIAADAFGRLQPKLLDFGIAKVEHQTNFSKLTQVGAVLGSPEYMSPEQARGDEDIDASSDVWSMCVMLYEMISAQLPFEHENYNALMQAILHEEPTATPELGAGDAELWRVISHGLKKQREDRWASMTELGEALALWLYEHGVKEDICGNSVRAVWLDGALSGVRADVASVSPARFDVSTQGDIPTLPPGSRLSVRWLRAQFLRVKSRLKRAKSAWAVALAGAGVGVALTLSLTWGSDSAPVDERSSSARAASTSANRGQAVAEQPRKLRANETPPAASVDKPAARGADSAGALAPAAEEAENRPKAPQARVRRVAKPTPAPRPKSVPTGLDNKKSIHDFGF